MFRVDREILAQAQVTQVRDNLKDAAQSGDYDSLYTDFGMYGYGRNNLASYMVPASTFKFYTAFMAIEVDMWILPINATSKSAIYRRTIWETPNHRGLWSQ